MTTQMEEENDSHYLKSVTSLGDIRNIVTSRDIYSKNGIKLAGRGSRIDSSFYDRLVRHKLMLSLDQCMTAENAVTAEELLAGTKKLFEDEPRFFIITQLVDIKKIWSAISRIRLNDALAFKLTVAREMRPEILKHSLRILLVSLCIGSKCRLSEADLTDLAAAAIFHDLGELHIDPELLKKNDLIPEERKHIYAHPMTAFLILKEFPEYHPVVSNAVLQHHEHLDGSGYPAGISGQRISPLAQILGVAEVTGGVADPHRLEIVLKLNMHRLNTTFIGHALELLKPNQEISVSDLSIAEIGERLSQLARAFEAWSEICRTRDAPIFKLANQRILELRHSLFDAGFNPLELDWLTSGIENDPGEIRDVQTIVNESFWQIRNLERELNRLWPDFEKADDADKQTLKDWIGRYTGNLH